MSFDGTRKHAASQRAESTPKRQLPPPDKLLIQRAMADPARLDTPSVRKLQRIVGNRTLQRILARGRSGTTVQRQAPTNGTSPVVQREEGDDEESWDLEELFKSDEDKEADRAKATYEKVPAGMEKYARRDIPTGFRDKAKAGTLASYSKALSLPRNDDGTLSSDALKLLHSEQAKESQGYIDDSAKAGFIGAPTDKAGMRALKKDLKGRKVGALDADLNEITGKSRMPELANLTNPKGDKALAAYRGATGKADAAVVSSFPMAGVNLLVSHSVSDVNLKPRLKMFEGAIQKIQDAGFKLPGTLLVNLPKFGRSIDVQKMCVVGSGTPRAVFNPPNFIHLSPAVVGNPIDEKKGGQDFYTLSSNLDPEGPGTVVHEMGHLLHYQASAENFFGLQSASHRQPMIARKVSTYATNSPREFVAEVFLGLVYGKDFDDDVLQMYTALGGPTSPKVAAAGRGGAGGGGA